MPSSKNRRVQPCLLKYTLHKTVSSKPTPLSFSWPIARRPKPKKAKPALSPVEFLMKKRARRTPSKLWQCFTPELLMERWMNHNVEGEGGKEEVKKQEVDADGDVKMKDMSWREDIDREGKRAQSLIERLKKRRDERRMMEKDTSEEAERRRLFESGLRRQLETEMLMQLQERGRNRNRGAVKHVEHVAR